MTHKSFPVDNAGDICCIKALIAANEIRSINRQWKNGYNNAVVAERGVRIRIETLFRYKEQKI